MERVKELIGWLVSQGISILNNHSGILLNREEFRTITFSFSQYGEDLVVFNLLKNRDPSSGFYVDAGCYHPFHLSTTNLIYRNGWRGINIDLDPKRLALFDTYRPGDIQALAALSDIEEEVLYVQYSEPLLDRILPLSATSKTDVASFGVQPVKEQVIQTQLLTKVLDQYTVSNQRFDYLNVDCEGNDLKVVQGLDFTRFHPYLITIEANNVNEKNKIISFLESHNYKYNFALGVTLLFTSFTDD